MVLQGIVFDRRTFPGFAVWGNDSFPDASNTVGAVWGGSLLANFVGLGAYRE